MSIRVKPEAILPTETAMSTKAETKVHRYREKALSDPQGSSGVRYPMVRVTEGPKIPDGAKATTVEPHDWRIDENAEETE